MNDGLQRRMASSAYVMTLAPRNGRWDDKIALEIGMTVLLDKPLVLVTGPGRDEIPPGLRRIASRVIELREPLETDAGRHQLALELATFDPEAVS